MAAHAEVKHDFHLVDPSPWPFVASFFVFLLAFGGVALMHGVVVVPEGETGFWADLSRTVLVKGRPALFWIGASGVTFSSIGWWMDVVRESRKGDHTPVVDIGLRYGMILFIASEVMFFVAWFWVFFQLSIFHAERADWYIPTWEGTQMAADWASWPPPDVITFDPFHLPLMNTLILLLSGTTVTWAHHALQQGDRRGAFWGLLFTVLLGAAFTYVQFVLEYPHAGFAFGNSPPEVTQNPVTNANLYGASFFMATGFHGVHVIIGTIFLAVCLLRLTLGQFTPKKHFGLEAAAWYWHFVDVVWLFLFTFVYVLPYVTME